MGAALELTVRGAEAAQVEYALSSSRMLVDPCALHRASFQAKVEAAARSGNLLELAELLGLGAQDVPGASALAAGGEPATPGVGRMAGSMGGAVLTPGAVGSAEYNELYRRYLAASDAQLEERGKVRVTRVRVGFGG